MFNNEAPYKRFFKEIKEGDIFYVYNDYYKNTSLARFLWISAG